MLAECYHPLRNGVVTSVDTFATSLRQRGHKVTILTSDHKDKDLSDDEINMVHRFAAITLPFKTNYPLPIPLIAGKMREVILDGDFDIVHSQSLMNMGNVAKYTAKKKKLPLVLTYHTLIEEYYHYFPFMPPSSVATIARNISYNYGMRANHIIVPGKHVYDRLKSYGITTNISVIPTGISLNEVDSAEPIDLTRYGVPSGAKSIVYAGRIAPEKNISQFFDTYELLAKEVDDLHLILVGGGPLFDECVKRANLSEYKNKIHFTNYVPKSEVLGIFKSADLMLFPSYSETQGLVFAESMACGAPVVAVDSFAARDIITHGENGILCENDANELKNACIEILSNESLYKAIQENAIKRAKDYDTNVMTERLLEVYNSVL